MKKEFRKHLQKFCDISNWSRMHKPRAGKANAEAAEELAENILRMFLKNEPGYDGTNCRFRQKNNLRHNNRLTVILTEVHKNIINNKMTEEMFVEKPEGKPVKKFKARVSLYPNDVVVVNPQEPRESNRKMIKQKGKSSFYKSEGEKESSYSIHINVDANDPDPVATMQEYFNELTKGELKGELKLQVKGKLIYDTPVLQIYLNMTQKQVIIKTTLDCGPTIERELLQLQGDMGRVIGANYSEIIKVFNQATKKKEGKEPSYPTAEEIIDRV